MGLKALLIAYSYPPDQMVGAFRPAKVARALVAAGHDVDVVTARIPTDQAGPRSTDPHLRVHPVREIRNPRHAYLALKRLPARLGRARNSTGPTGEEAGPTHTPSQSIPAHDTRHHAVTGVTPPTWKRVLISLLWLPDENQGFIPPAVGRALKLARRGADLIYTTAPPFSDHLAGWLLKRLTGLPWVLELRDPWADRHNRSPAKYSRLTDRMNRWLEARCLRAADRVIAVSPSVYEQLRAKLGPAADGRLFLVLNGIDSIRTTPPAPEPGPFRIVHTGSLYNDPRPFLGVVGRAARRLGLRPGDLQLEFIGQQPYFTGPTVTELAAELGLDGSVSFSGWIPQAEARAHVDGADLLLLLCEGFPTAVPNKLFDYLGARKPILAIVDPDGQSDRVLRTQRGHVVADSSQLDTVEEALVKAIQERVAHRELLNDPELLREWSTNTQMERLVDIVTSAVTGHAGAQATTAASAR